MARDPRGDVSLDPSDWNGFRELSHQMVDDMIDQLAGLDASPVWQPMPAAAKDELRRPLPREGVGEQDAYRVFRESILPYTNGNRHPRFFGWVQGNGTPLGMMADMLAAGMNPHCAGFEQSSLYVELQVLDWLREIMGFPGESSGVLVSGGTMANFIGLAAARDAACQQRPRGDGLQGSAERLAFYGSSETHGWALKSAHVLGLGTDAFRTVPVDDDLRIRIDELRRAIARDREGGIRPFCVLGTAGTINTGATDDLVSLAALCRDEGLWFHVDGAFGAWARLSTTHRATVDGMELADSLAFDLHKWGYQPFEVACALVRDRAAHRRPFALAGAYLTGSDRGVNQGLPFAELGVELTRGFRALKVWFTLAAYGTDRLAALIDQNIAQASRFATLVDADPHLERIAPVPLNVVCFRAVGAGMSPSQLDALNGELLLRVQESGFAVPSSTTIAGRFGLRCAFVNHRTRAEDVERLAATIGEIGRQLLAEGVPETDG